MQTGRFKIFKHLNQLWNELRLYHRKEGKIVKEDDHLLDAMRYAVMMLRHARTAAEYRSFNSPIRYPGSLRRYV
jgi:Terminase RNaseH-like domain